MRVIKINNVGDVAFPDSMADEDVSSASGKLHAQANPAKKLDLSSVMEHIAGHKQPDQTTSEHLKGLAQIAKVLEENPALAKLAIGGLQRTEQGQA
jgi:hypothetical protein